MVMVFNVTFNNISVISWRLVLRLVEETGVPGEIHRLVTSHRQTRSHNVVSCTHQHERNKKEFEDIKGRIRIRISTKDRQHNDQRKKYKGTNNDLQNIHIKLKIE